MLSHAYNIVNDRGVGAPENGRYVVDVLNATDIRFFEMLITTVKLTGSVTKNPHMVMHTARSNTNISISRVLKNIFQNQHVHMD